MNISKACGQRTPQAVCFLIPTLLSVKHQAPFPNFVYGECIYNSTSNQKGFSFGFMERRLAVTHRKEHPHVSFYDNVVVTFYYCSLLSFALKML